MFVPSKFPVKVQTKMKLDILGELNIVYMNGGGGARFSSCGECDMD
jgi:hypothetical protein